MEQWDPCRIQRRLLPGSCPEPGSASPGPGAPVIVSEGKPDKYVVGFSSACVCGAGVDLLAVVVAVQGAIGIIENSRKRWQLCTPFVDARHSFAAPHWFFPLVLETVLSVCISRLIWSYVCYNMKNSLSILQFGLLAVLNYAGGSSSVS